MSNLGGALVDSIVCHVPPSGAWWATVVLSTGIDPPVVGSATTLAIGDLTLAGGIIRSGMEAPSSPRAVVVGGPGWWRPLEKAASWQSDAGVKLSTVLDALMKATGESLTKPEEARPFVAYGWPAGGAYAPSTGAMVLGDLVTRGALSSWHVEPAGGAVCEAWPSIGEPKDVRVMERRLDVGMRVVGLDTRVKAYLPGSTIEGVPVRRAYFRETAGKLQGDLWAA